MKTKLTLVVDDEPDIRELLEITLNRMGVDTHSAENLKEAKRLLSRYSFDFCLTDMKLPDGDGLELVDFIQTHKVPIPIAVITAHGNMDIAIKAMKQGAFDFLSKPVDLVSLRLLVQHALKISEQVSAKKDRRTRHLLLGNSQAMCDIRSKIDKVARSQAPVYIRGESGTGKELVARLIHQQGPREDRSFIAVNCGAIPHELMESEFFGHKKGSFTGATVDKQGLFKAADGGTLFLDEVADLPLSLQVKLLRAIQEKKIRPIGEQQELSINIRLLSATHKDLNKMVDDGVFRQDLYYRINVIELTTSPLRTRTADIPELTDYLLSKLAKDNDQIKPSLSTEATEGLKHYHFPGNVRELENILESALALYDGDMIEYEDLNLPVNNKLSKENPFDPSEDSLEDYLENIEKSALKKALEENKWNKTETAKHLGLTFRSLRYRLKKLELE